MLNNKKVYQILIKKKYSMKKVLFLCSLFVLFIGLKTHAQVSNYLVTDTTLTYSSISGVGTALTFGSVDDSYASATLPFAFSFGQQSYTAGATIYLGLMDM